MAAKGDGNPDSNARIRTAVAAARIRRPRNRDCSALYSPKLLHRSVEIDFDADCFERGARVLPLSTPPNPVRV